MLLGMLRSWLGCITLVVSTMLRRQICGAKVRQREMRGQPRCYVALNRVTAFTIGEGMIGAFNKIGGDPALATR